MSPEDQKPGVELTETVSGQVDDFLDDPAGLGTRRERPAQKAELGVKSPHERAVDRHEAAVEAWQATVARAAEMVLAAEREVGESLTELARYEKQPGIALPVADQRRIEDRMAVTRQRMAQIKSEDR